MDRGRTLSQLAQVLNARAPKHPNWPAIVQLAGEQLVVPQLHRPLLAMRERAPADVWSYVEEVRRRTRARNARLAGTLAEALSALNAAGIAPVLLKGCALWAETPPAECDRLISDLDLLVLPEEMQPAIDALAEAGFGILEDDRTKRDHDVVVLGRPSDPGAIDLHQRPPGPRGAVMIARDELRSVQFQGCHAWTPSPELQIFIAAVHDQLHDGYFWRGGFELRRLLDIAAMAEGPVDWARLAALCTSPEVRTALAVQLVAAHSLAGANVPHEMLAGAWGRIHYWRQRLQFAWPWTNAIFDAIRQAKGAAGVQRAVWRWLLRRTSISEPA